MSRNQDPAPRLHYCFLTALLLSLQLLPSLISNCWCLPFGTQRRSWKQESISYRQEMGDRKASMPRNPRGSCSFSESAPLWAQEFISITGHYHPHLLFYTALCNISQAYAVMRDAAQFNANPVNYLELTVGAISEQTLCFKFSNVLQPPCEFATALQGTLKHSFRTMALVDTSSLL